MDLPILLSLPHDYPSAMAHHSFELASYKAGANVDLPSLEKTYACPPFSSCLSVCDLRPLAQTNPDLQSDLVFAQTEAMHSAVTVIVSVVVIVMNTKASG